MYIYIYHFLLTTYIQWPFESPSNYLVPRVQAIRYFNDHCNFAIEKVWVIATQSFYLKVIKV